MRSQHCPGPGAAEPARPARCRRVGMGSLARASLSLALPAQTGWDGKRCLRVPPLRVPCPQMTTQRTRCWTSVSGSRCSSTGCPAKSCSCPQGPRAAHGRSCLSPGLQPQPPQNHLFPSMCFKPRTLVSRRCPEVFPEGLDALFGNRSHFPEGLFMQLLEYIVCFTLHVIYFSSMCTFMCTVPDESRSSSAFFFGLY